jgi:hypothetical protein
MFLERFVGSSPHIWERQLLTYDLLLRSTSFQSAIIWSCLWAVAWSIQHFNCQPGVTRRRSNRGKVIELPSKFRGWPVPSISSLDSHSLPPVLHNAAPISSQHCVQDGSALVPPVSVAITSLAFFPRVSRESPVHERFRRGSRVKAGRGSSRRGC